MPLPLAFEKKLIDGLRARLFSEVNSKRKREDTCKLQQGKLKTGFHKKRSFVIGVPNY